MATRVNDMKINVRVLAIILISIFFLGSLNIVSANIFETTSTKSLSKWTFIGYLDGDSDLEDEAIEALNRMELVGSDSNLNIVVQIDDKHIWGGQTRRYYVTYDTDMNNINSQLADENTSEKNMAKGETLTEFILWAVDNYPAEHYFLTLFDHGGGWRGMCWDESCGNNSNCITMEELKESLSIAYAQIGKKIDIMCLNACEMGNIEVFYQVKDYIDIGIASEDIQYTLLPYDLFLGDLSNNPSMTSEQLAKEVVNDSFYCDYQAVNEISAYSSDGINDVAEKVDALAKKLIQYLPENYRSIRRAISKTICPWVFYDLYDFASELIERLLINKEIKNSAQDLMDAIENAVIESQSKNYGEEYCFGFSIYLEHRASFYSTKYEKLDFAEDTQWDEFLKTYYTADKSLSRIKTKSFNFNRLDEFFERFPNAFPILRQLIGLQYAKSFFLSLCSFFFELLYANKSQDKVF